MFVRSPQGSKPATFQPETFQPMLRLYISCAPADKPYLDTLLKWLGPLKEKYFLRIWHNPAPCPEPRYRTSGTRC